jgi:3D (Asp-Asp-Asp) domain-containing protein
MKAFFLRVVMPAFSLSLVGSLASYAQTATQDAASPAVSQVSKQPESRPQDQIGISIPSATTVLNIAPAQPPLDYSIQPHPSKLELPDFDKPELKSRSAPRAFRATAYSLRGRTASGVETGPGIVAADPSVLPLGSIVEIRAGDYSGVYTVHDTGSAVKGNLVDLWVRSSKEARQFGRRSIKLHVLRYGPKSRVAKVSP